MQANKSQVLFAEGVQHLPSHVATHFIALISGTRTWRRLALRTKQHTECFRGQELYSRRRDMGLKIHIQMQFILILLFSPNKNIQFKYVVKIMFSSLILYVSREFKKIFKKLLSHTSFLCICSDDDSSKEQGGSAPTQDIMC